MKGIERDVVSCLYEIVINKQKVNRWTDNHLLHSLVNTRVLGSNVNSLYFHHLINQEVIDENNKEID